MKLAEAQAKANRTIAASLTPELIQSQTVNKWDGKLPVYTGGVSPMISLPAPTK